MGGMDVQSATAGLNHLPITNLTPDTVKRAPDTTRKYALNEDDLTRLLDMLGLGVAE